MEPFVECLCSLQNCPKFQRYGGDWALTLCPFFSSGLLVNSERVYNAITANQILLYCTQYSIKEDKHMPVPNDIIQARIRYQLEGGSRCENVFHFVIEAAGGTTITDANLITAIGAWYDTVMNNLETYISNGSGTPEILVDEMQWTGTLWRIFRNIGYMMSPSTAFTSAGNPLPAGVAALLRLVPIYVKHAAKKFFGGFTVSALDTDGDWTGVFLTSLAAAGVAMLNTQAVVSTPAGAVIRYIVLNHIVGTYNVPVEVVTPLEPAYQRRRKEGVGV